MRGWHEFVAAVGDLVPGGVPVIGLGLLLFTTVGAVLWYYWPDWLPSWRRRARRSGPDRRRSRAGGAPRLRRLLTRLRVLFHPGSWRWRWRWRWRRRHRGKRSDPTVDLPADALPDLPAATLTLTADEYAAQGRYKEAVRERLRAIVRDLVERQVIDYRPGWTVTELARLAGAARPATAAPLAAASEIFSGIWYGRRPAGPEQDAAMREHAAAVRAALAGPVAAGVIPERTAGSTPERTEPAGVRLERTEPGR